MSRVLRTSIPIASILLMAATVVLAQPAPKPPKPATPPSSYQPVALHEPFPAVVARMKAAKPEIMKRQMSLLAERYDVSDHADSGATMSRGKPLQGGVRVKLSGGTTWDGLAQMTPDQIRDKDVFPAGFMPLPHANHPEGGMIFPKFHIDAIKKEEERDLARFDLDFDIPEHFLPEFPAPIYLTTRPDLGDVTKGKLLTIENFYDIFNGVLNPKQIEKTGVPRRQAAA